MDNEALTIYKLMIMDMLSCVDFALTNSQLSQFILEKGYTGYFNIQQSLADLLDTGLISADRIYNSTYYSLTADGEETLRDFIGRLSPEIQREIRDYISSHRSFFRNTNEITADYEMLDKNNYRVICQVRGGRELIENITLKVTSEDMAIAICDNWPEHYEDIYSFLVEKLMIRGGRKG